MFEKSSGGGTSVGDEVTEGVMAMVAVGDAVWVGRGVIVGLRVGEANTIAESTEG